MGTGGHFTSDTEIILAGEGWVGIKICIEISWERHFSYVGLSRFGKDGQGKKEKRSTKLAHPVCQKQSKANSLRARS